MTHLVSNTGETIIPPHRSSDDSSSSEAPLSKAGRPPPIDDDDSDDEAEYRDLPPPYELFAGIPSKKRSDNKVMNNIKHTLETIKTNLTSHDQHSVVKDPYAKVPQHAKTNPME